MATKTCTCPESQGSPTWQPPANHLGVSPAPAGSRTRPTLERISYGMPLNWRSGVWEPHMRRMTHLDSMSALSVRPAQPRRMHTSNRHRISRPAARWGARWAGLLENTGAGGQHMTTWEMPGFAGGVAQLLPCWKPSRQRDLPALAISTKHPSACGQRRRPAPVSPHRSA